MPREIEFTKTKNLNRVTHQKGKKLKVHSDLAKTLVDEGVAKYADQKETPKAVAPKEPKTKETK